MRNKRGFSRLEWQKLRERNEALDCRVYARAAAWIAGADRWSEGRWADLESQLQVEPAAASNDQPASAGAIRSVQRVVRRRSLPSSTMR